MPIPPYFTLKFTRHCHINKKYSDTFLLTILDLNIEQSIRLTTYINVSKDRKDGKQVDPHQTPRSAASDLGQPCLLIPVGPNSYCKYGIMPHGLFRTNTSFHEFL